MFIDAIDFGERAGNLEQVLEKSSELFDRELSKKIGLLSTLFQPVLLLLAGLTVGCDGPDTDVGEFFVWNKASAESGPADSGRTGLGESEIVVIVRAVLNGCRECCGYVRIEQVLPGCQVECVGIESSIGFSGWLMIGLLSGIVCILIWIFIDIAREKDPQRIAAMWNA